MHIYHITWATHNSRLSERMIVYKVKHGEPRLLDLDEEVEITRYIRDIVIENGIMVIAYNICRDHVHLLLACEENERDNIIRKLKGKSTHLFKRNHGINETYHLWNQKYGKVLICDETQLKNVYEYIRYNRRKHKLPNNKALRTFIRDMLVDEEQLGNIFSTD